MFCTKSCKKPNLYEMTLLLCQVSEPTCHLVTSMGKKLTDSTTTMSEKVCLDKLQLGKNKETIVVRLLRMWKPETLNSMELS